MKKTLAKEVEDVAKTHAISINENASVLVCWLKVAPTEHRSKHAVRRSQDESLTGCAILVSPLDSIETD